MSVINTNLQALITARQLDQSQEMLGRSLNRLSSGTKLVQPSDDAAGAAVSAKLGAQNLRLQAASTNVQNAISYVQTSDGFMSGMSGILSRMSELTTLAKDPTKSSSDIDLYQQEFTSLQDQLRQTIGGTTSEIGGQSDVQSPLGSFNGLTLFGSNPNGQVVAIGENVGQDMTIPETNLRQGAMLSLIQQDADGNYTLNLSDSSAISTVTDATQQVAGERATLGASQSRLDLASATLQIEQQNISSAVSRISDVDVAQESTQYAKYNILVQSGTAMLSQANQAPQSVLQLLQH